MKRGEGGRPETRSEGRNGQDARCPSTPPRWRLTIRADVLGMGAGSSTNAMLRRDEVIAPYHSAACTFRGCARIFVLDFFVLAFATKIAYYIRRFPIGGMAEWLKAAVC